MTMTATQRILDLSARAPSSRDEDLVLLLREAMELYHQGFDEARRASADRSSGLSCRDLAEAVSAAGMPCDGSLDRDELVLLLAVSQWELTPAALAYGEMALSAARRGVVVIPDG
ncbi:hypothetical protein [Streptomyces sp. NPDC094468]|uniref:hypothetical protein n=1 Tax=Streptomyces sp. NPDC094468 TaxID=3366066 RepID=UPI0038167C4D